MKRLAATGLALALLQGCSWVDLTAEGAEVTVMTSAPDHCERLGSSNAATKRDVGFIERNREKVEGELETLARNAAGRMGGDTIVRESSISAAGEQRFGVYRCR